MGVVVHSFSPKQCEQIVFHHTELAGASVLAGTPALVAQYASVKTLNGLHGGALGREIVMQKVFSWKTGHSVKSQGHSVPLSIC